MKTISRHIREIQKILFAALITAVIFYGCLKSSDVVEPSVVNNSPNKPSIEVVIPQNICAGEEFSLTAALNISETGKLEIVTSEDNGRTWISAGESVIKKEDKESHFYFTFKSGDYKIKARFTASGSGKFYQSEIYNLKAAPFSDCESLTLEPNLAGSNHIVHAGESKIFTVEYTVLACDRDYKDMEVRGVLLPKADYHSSVPAHAEIKLANRNRVLSWKIGDIERGYSKMFRAEFEMKIPDVPYGTMIPITGGWTLRGKTADGSDVLIGNNNEVYVQVQ